MKKIILAISVLSISFCASAQSGTNRYPKDSIYTPPVVEPNIKTPDQNQISTDPSMKKDTVHHDMNNPDMNNKDMDGSNHTINNQTSPNHDLHNPSVDVKSTTTTTKIFVIHDGYKMRAGKLMMIKDGKEILVEKAVMMSNGITIMSDGTILKKDGSKSMLKEGEYMDMNGKIIPTGTTVTPK